MNKNIFKHKNSRIKWNISILVIFVLIASSLIWILTTNYIRDLMQYNDIIHWYYKSYYLAKAWLEISLTQIWQNWIWFENTINTWNNIVSWNLICKNCSFNSEILWNSDYFSQNTRTESWCITPISLKTGESIILPLFKQVNTWTNYQKLTNSPIYQNMADKISQIQFQNTIPSQEITIWIVIISWQNLLQDGIFVKTGIINDPNIINTFLSNFHNYWANITVWIIPLSTAYKASPTLKSFLIFGNTKQWQDSVNFCIKIQPQLRPISLIKLPDQTFYIKSIWNNIEKTVWLEAFFKQPIPGFLSHTSLE